MEGPPAPSNRRRLTRGAAPPPRGGGGGGVSGCPCSLPHTVLSFLFLFLLLLLSFKPSAALLQEHGASRNYEPWKDRDAEADAARAERCVRACARASARAR